MTGRTVAELGETMSAAEFFQWVAVLSGDAGQETQADQVARLF